MHEEDVAVNQHLSRELDEIIGLISLNEGCSLSRGCRIELIKSQQKPACGGVSWLLSKKSADFVEFGRGMSSANQKDPGPIDRRQKL